MADLPVAHARPAAGLSWYWPALLAAPFLVCMAVLLVTGWTFPTFWGDDELSHWALIRWFAAGFPHFRAAYPATATTPLFHLAGACLVRLAGADLQFLRACNALLSAGGVLVLYGLLRRRPFGHAPATAVLLCVVFGSSAYYFGYAFRLLTDNAAVLGCLLAMGELFRFADPAEARPLRRFTVGCGWCGLTILTRQSYVFLYAPFGLALLMAPLTPRQKALGIGAMGLALVPFAALVWAWHGPVPPDFQERHAAGLVHLYPLALPVMLLGLYAPFFFGPVLWRRLRAGTLPPRWWIGPTVGIAVALAVLIFFPLFPVVNRPDLATYIPTEGRENWSIYFGGWVYALAGRGTRFALRHNSLFFWLVLPLGGAALGWFLPEGWRTSSRRRVAALFLMGVLLSSLINAVSSQKYYDALVLLYLAWREDDEVTGDRWRRWCLYALIAVFCAYAVAFPFFSRSQELHLPAPVLPPPP